METKPGLLSLAWWAVVFFRHPSTWAYVDAWVVATLASWALARAVQSPLVALPRWTTAHSIALMLVLLLVPALVARPFAKLGSVDRYGNHLYRAYFIADFVWHTALTAELAKESIKTGRSIRDLVLARGLRDQSRLDRILSPDAMTRGGIVGE